MLKEIFTDRARGTVHHIWCLKISPVHLCLAFHVAYVSQATDDYFGTTAWHTTIGGHWYTEMGLAAVSLPV